VERNGHVPVSNRYSIAEPELFLQTESPLEPFRALVWVANGEAEVTHYAQSKRRPHDFVSQSIPGPPADG